MSGVMMACGCAAVGTRRMADGSNVPTCITHSCIEVAAAPPDLSGRMAKCSYTTCKTPPQPSDPAKLAFFVYRGPGSPEAEESCVCGYHKIAHDDPERRKNIKCRTFRPKGPQQFDHYYCGCHGWD